MAGRSERRPRRPRRSVALVARCATDVRTRTIERADAVGHVSVGSFASGIGARRVTWPIAVGGGFAPPLAGLNPFA